MKKIIKILFLIFIAVCVLSVFVTLSAATAAQGEETVDPATQYSWEPTYGNMLWCLWFIIPDAIVFSVLIIKYIIKEKEKHKKAADEIFRAELERLRLDASQNKTEGQDK